MRTNRTELNNPMLERDPDEPMELSDRDYQAREARQGRMGRPVLAVLLGGIALAFLVWAGVEFYGSSLPGTDKPGDTTTTATTSTPSGGDNLQNSVPTTDNPNGAATRQAAPSQNGSQPTTGAQATPPTSTNDGQMPGTGSSTNDPGSATTGGTAPNSPSP